ncbi:MAG: Protein of unknown function, DUF488 [Chloroflexi bacterium]|jgi:hypothetical protein|nr:MAG: Protein of unknown function, DUF488 [Chloroflexota bacterium]
MALYADSDTWEPGMLTMASWYQSENWQGRLFRISQTAGRGRGLKKSVYDWGVVRCLIPTWEMVKGLRSGGITQQGFSEMYRHLLEQRRVEVSEWLALLSPDEDTTLLCHEREGEFCHRRLVADIVALERPDVRINLK